MGGSIGAPQHVGEQAGAQAAEQCPPQGLALRFSNSKINIKT